MRIEKETCHLCVKFMLLYMKKNKIQPIFAGSGKWMGCCFACALWTITDTGYRKAPLARRCVWIVLLFGRFYYTGSWIGLCIIYT